MLPLLYCDFFTKITAHRLLKNFQIELMLLDINFLMFAFNSSMPDCNILEFLVNVLFLDFFCMLNKQILIFCLFEEIMKSNFCIVFPCIFILSLQSDQCSLLDFD